MSVNSRDGGNSADEERSEFGAIFETQTRGSQADPEKPGKPVPSVATEGITRAAPVKHKIFGRGPVQPDPRKFRYDVERGRSMAAVPWQTSKADRMDAREAGDLLHEIHAMFGIENVRENILAAFDEALFFEHTLNGASQLQPSRGHLDVAGTQFPVGAIVAKLGLNARRFFRAFADEVAAANRAVLDSYDPYDPVSVERVAQLKMVALKRGLHKFPYLAHDSSEACSDLSGEELTAVVNAKRYYLAATENNVDKLI